MRAQTLPLIPFILPPRAHPLRTPLQPAPGPAPVDVTESIRAGLSVVMLVGAGISDIRTRRVRNHYWFPFVALAAVFVLHDLLVADVDVRLLGIHYGVALALTGLFYGLWWFGLFGGADAKGLMVLAWLLPWPLDAAIPVPPVMDALVNGTLAVLVLPLVYLAVNLVRGDTRFPAMLIGRRMPLADAQVAQVFPLQHVVDGEVRWRWWQRIGVPLDDVYRDLRRAGVDPVWTTWKIPLMAAIALGLAGALAWGNVWLWALSAWLS